MLLKGKAWCPASGVERGRNAGVGRRDKVLREHFSLLITLSGGPAPPAPSHPSPVPVLETALGIAGRHSQDPSRTRARLLPAGLSPAPLPVTDVPTAPAPKLNAVHGAVIQAVGWDGEPSVPKVLGYQCGMFSRTLHGLDRLEVSGRAESVF